MKIREMGLNTFEPLTEAWSGDFQGILWRLGFTLRSVIEGSRNNRTDGEYDYTFIVDLGNKLYSIHINSNIWCNEKEKLQHILEADIEEI